MLSRHCHAWAANAKYGYHSACPGSSQKRNGFTVSFADQPFTPGIFVPPSPDCNITILSVGKTTMLNLTFNN